jgi:hypothetical protein
MDVTKALPVGADSFLGAFLKVSVLLNALAEPLRSLISKLIICCSKPCSS